MTETKHGKTAQPIPTYSPNTNLNLTVQKSICTPPISTSLSDKQIHYKHNTSLNIKTTSVKFIKKISNEQCAIMPNVYIL